MFLSLFCEPESLRKIGLATSVTEGLRGIIISVNFQVAEGLLRRQLGAVTVTVPQKSQYCESMSVLARGPARRRGMLICPQSP
jgi:hypothetical protein